MPEFVSFQGQKISIFGTGAGCDDPDVHILRNLGNSGISDDPSGVMTGQNSGYQALNIAVLAGAKRILLLGIDMVGKHWHPEHPDPSGANIYHGCIWHMNKAAPLLKSLGVEVLNCSPISALKCFPKVDIESLLPNQTVAALQA